MPEEKSARFLRARSPGQIEQRREAILKAALDLFEEKDLEKVSLTDIGHRVGTAKSNLYRYFESREHIYLILLQREGMAWEKKVVPLLTKLNGKGTIRQVGDLIADSFIACERYSLLITVINSVLEKNLTPSGVASFRSVFYERRERLAKIIAAALPKTKAREVASITLPIFAHVAGLWPMCHPPSSSVAMLEQPEYAHLKLDFRTEMSRFVRLMLKGAMKD